MVISENAKDRRHRWINEIVTISGEFGSDASRIESELSEEIEQDGVIALLNRPGNSGDPLVCIWTPPFMQQYMY